jgi:RHS repeat-associated protein
VQRTQVNLPFGDGFVETPLTPILDFTGYAGGTSDSENIADHFGAREYDKTPGRWFSPDPAGLEAVDPSNPQTWNLYAYVMHNPLSLRDPGGLEAIGQQWGELPGQGNCQDNTEFCFKVEAKAKRDTDVSKIGMDSFNRFVFVIGAVGHHGFPRALFRFLKGIIPTRIDG